MISIVYVSDAHTCVYGLRQERARIQPLDDELLAIAFVGRNAHCSHIAQRVGGKIRGGGCVEIDCFESRIDHLALATREDTEREEKAMIPAPNHAC